MPGDSEPLSVEQLDAVAAGFAAAVFVEQLADGTWAVVSDSGVIVRTYPNEGMATAVALYLNCPSCSPRPDYF